MYEAPPVTPITDDATRFPVFAWDDHYNIGIEDIDLQHRHLVDLMNRLSQQLLQGSVTSTERHAYLQELVDYTHYHFADEESFMEAAGLEASFIREHKLIHQQFVRQLAIFTPEIEHNTDETMGVLLKFLFSWLIFHILGSDHAIQEQLVLIGEGVSPHDAATRVQQSHDVGQVGPLLHALGSFFDLLSDRNRELRDMNATLEWRVAERTRELDEANNTLLLLSQTDALTGLPNRRHAVERLALLWAEVQASGQPLSCLMIDADYFKEVNDQHGHAAGDQVLKALAVTLRDTARSDDLVARLGGDEFCVLCPRTTLEGALKLAGQLLSAVSSLKVATGEDSYWKSSISIGVACSEPGEQQRDDLFRVADEGLYLAKAAGRTCVRSVQTA